MPMSYTSSGGVTWSSKPPWHEKAPEKSPTDFDEFYGSSEDQSHTTRSQKDTFRLGRNIAVTALLAGFSILFLSTRKTRAKYRVLPGRRMPMPGFQHKPPR